MRRPDLLGLVLWGLGVLLAGLFSVSYFILGNLGGGAGFAVSAITLFLLGLPEVRR